MWCTVMDSRLRGNGGGDIRAIRFIIEILWNKPAHNGGLENGLFELFGGEEDVEVQGDALPSIFKIRSY